MRVRAQLHFAIGRKDAKEGIASVSLGDGAVFTGELRVRDGLDIDTIIFKQVKSGKEYTFSYDTEAAFGDELTKWITLECEVEFTKLFTVNVQSYDGTQVSFTPVVDKVVKPALTIAANDSSHRRQRSYSEEDLSPISKKLVETSAVSSSSSGSSSSASSSSPSSSSSSSFFSTTLPSARQQLLANQIIQDADGNTVFCAMSWNPPVTAEDMKGFRELVSKTAIDITDFIFNENKIEDQGCLELQQITTIKYLAVAENNISDIGAIALSRIPCLQRLVISSNEITGVGLLALIRNGKELTSVDASFNNISDIDATKILSIQNSRLVYLDLTGNDDVKPATLEKLSAWLKHNETNLPKTISCAQ